MTGSIQCITYKIVLWYQTETSHDSLDDTETLDRKYMGTKVPVTGFHADPCICKHGHSSAVYKKILDYKCGELKGTVCHKKLTVVQHCRKAGR